VTFTPDGVRRIAEIAWHVNERIENIGARRLHTVLERLLEEISYSASDITEKVVKIDADYVNKRLQDLIKDEDLSGYIL
jgi:ATP-dependent HslUV protease ATP-binding subunit HslU